MVVWGGREARKKRLLRPNASQKELENRWFFRRTGFDSGSQARAVEFCGPRKLRQAAMHTDPVSNRLDYLRRSLRDWRLALRLHREVSLQSDRWKFST